MRRRRYQPKAWFPSNVNRNGCQGINGRHSYGSPGCPPLGRLPEPPFSGTRRSHDQAHRLRNPLQLSDLHHIHILIVPRERGQGFGCCCLAN